MTDTLNVAAVINGEPCLAEPGDTLLEVARRNRAHIGFVCDGRGWCSTCECKVTEGGALLNRPTRMERYWLHPNRLANGYRLGCQAVIERPGSIRATTRAELLKRQFMASFDPPHGQSRVRTTTRFFGNLTRITVQHVEKSVDGLSGTFRDVGLFRFIVPWRNPARFVGDTGGVVTNELNEVTRRVPRADSDTVVIEVEEVAESVGTPNLSDSVMYDTPEHLAASMGLDPAAHVADAPVIPPAEPAPGSTPADRTGHSLLDILDIGPAFNKKLADAGIVTLEQLVDTPTEELARIVEVTPERITRNRWKEQAIEFIEQAKG
jgi:ferredoxin/predicted flap endonuclease-1-like 5' DNA nuclease